MARATGLEITEASVRAVEIDGSPRKFKVLGAAEVPIPREKRGDRQAAIQAVKSALRATKAKRDQIVLAIPAREAVVREILVPFTDEDQIRKVLKFESEGHLHGLDIEDVVVDYHKISESGPRSRLLIMAIRKSTLRSYLEILSRAGADPQQIDLDASALYGLSRLLPGTSEDEGGQVILDLGTVSTDMLVVSNGVLQMVRSLRLGSESVERSVSQGLGVDAGEAEDIARGESRPDEPFGVAGETDVPSTSTSLSSAEMRTQAVRLGEQDLGRRLVTEVRRTLGSIRMEGNLRGIWLTGPASDLPGIEHALATAFGVPVEPLDVLGSCDADVDPADARWMAIPMGLALKALGHDPLGLDFRQEELTFTGRFERLQWPLTIAASLVLLLLVLLTLINLREKEHHDRLVETYAKRSVADFDARLVRPALGKDGEAFRRTLGYENEEELLAIQRGIENAETADRMPRIRGALRAPIKHIESQSGFEVGAGDAGGPETTVKSALERLDQFFAAVRAAKARIGFFTIERLEISSIGIRWNMLVEKAGAWEALDQEFRKLADYESSERGSLKPQRDGNLNSYEDCRLDFTDERP